MAKHTLKILRKKTPCLKNILKNLGKPRVFSAGSKIISLKRIRNWTCLDPTFTRIPRSKNLGEKTIPNEIFLFETL